MKYSSETALFILKRVPRSRAPFTGRQTILIIRLATLGETLLTFPMVRELKRALPGSNITVLTQARALWELNRDVDDIVDYSFPGLAGMVLRGRRSFDVVIDTEPANNISAIAAYMLGRIAIGFDTVNRAPMFDCPVRFDSGQYEAQTFLDLLAPLGIGGKCDALVAPVPSAAGKRFAARLAKGKFRIGVNLGASCGAPRRLWPAEKYGLLVRRLDSEFPCQFVFFGLKREGELLRSISGFLEGLDCLDLTDSTNLHELSAVMKEMDILTSCDTGTMHLAAALGVPVFSIFGPNLPVRYAPRNTGSRFFYHEMTCSPCINVHLPQPKKAYDCNGECIGAISVEEVFTGVASYLRGVHGQEVVR